MSALLLGNCAAAPDHPSNAKPDTLSVGFPEGSVTGLEMGPSQFANMLSLEGLTHVGVDGRALPRLAESWTWEQDGRRLRMVIRPGVTFHDGTPLTAGVAATALRQLISRPANVARYPAIADIAELHAPSDRELIIDLREPSALLPEELDLPLEIGADHAGTGAYKVVARKPQLVLEQFEHYYLGSPAIRRIEVTTFEAMRVGWPRLLRGDLDMVTDVPPDSVEFIDSDALQVIAFPRRYQFAIAFNSARQPFHLPAVRRALNFAVDRQKLIDKLLKGYGVPATGPIWPKHWAYDGALQAFTYDPRQAESLLDAAGHGRGAAGASSPMPGARMRFTCLLPADFNILERIGLEVQKELYDIGVDMVFESIPAQSYDARIRDRDFDCVLIDMISGPTLGRAYLFWRSSRDFQGFNFFGYENAEAERLFRQLRASVNETGRVRSATNRLQRVFLDDPPALFLAWNERIRAVRSDVRVVRDADRDPLLSLWQWNTSPALASTGR